MADKDFRVKQGIVVGGDAFISNSITSVNSISFVDTQEFEPGRGSLAWANTEGSLSLGLTDTLHTYLNQSSLYYVINQSGFTIPANTVVMANGTVGNSGSILVSPAIGNGSFPSEYVMGLAASDIADGAEGYVTAFGKIRGINTSMFSEGDILYLNPAVPGTMMNTAPVAPNNKVTVAIVVTKSVNQGEIFVRPTYADKLSQLQDVAILDGITDGQTLIWVAANSRFENLTVTGDVANLYNTYTTLTANTYNTLLAAQSNDGVTLASARANDFSTFTTLTANIYNTFAYLNANAGGSANTAVYLGNTLVSNSALIFQTSNGLSITGNTTSKVISFAINMSNVTSQEITANGASNVFTLAKAVSNANMILVSYNGLLQKPSTYSASGTTLTLSNTTPIESGSDIEVRYFDFFDLPGASAGGGGGGYTFQGEVSGYSSGGSTPGGGSNVIDKFPFASNANATDVGDLTQTTPFNKAGQSSDISGYTTGGFPATGPTSNVIDKFPFASNANATDVGDLTQGRYNMAGQSSSASGYTSGGSNGVTAAGTIIDKFPFATNANATDVGDLTQGRSRFATQSSSISGYISGGSAGGAGLNTIDKFPFSADANATDVGDLTQGRYGSAGQSSTTSGYSSGGRTPTDFVNTIDKFPFATNANATDVGDLTVARRSAAGQSSTTHGYASGGIYPVRNTIDKFPFATDSNATDVGDLTVARNDIAGQQV
jgi:hypothetical protein